MNITKILLNLKYKGYSNLYKQIEKNQKKSLVLLEDVLISRVKDMLVYANENIEYYKEKFHQIGFNPQHFNALTDIDKIPIITKEEVKSNFEKITNKKNGKYYLSTTGGSTGTPMHYLLDKNSTMYGRAILQRGRGYAGFRHGDKIATFAGGSLTNKSNLKFLITDFFLNNKSFSTYGLSEDKMHAFYSYLNRRKPRYIYGYATSLYLFALFLEKNKLHLSYTLKGIFSTSEVLQNYQRIKIMENMTVNIFDSYGLNDGGVSAQECEMHCGLHIDTERSYLQIVDDLGNTIKEGTGKVIATTLTNYSMPFIRYETGDIATITYEKCKCGRETPRLTKIQGRTTDYLKLGETYIGSPVLTVLMGKFDIDLYQIRQTSEVKIEIKIVRLKEDLDYEHYIVSEINKSFKAKVSDVDLNIQFFRAIESIPITNKHKFIINETLLK